MKQMKSFVPYLLGNDTFYKWLGTAAKPANFELFSEKIEAAFMHSIDPTGAQWWTLGMVTPVDPLSYVHDLDGVARLIVLQFNERILPGAVRNEKLLEAVKEVEKRDGRKINKKDYAQLKEQIEEDLLPVSHIRRTLVPVLVYPKYMLVFATQAKKLDHIHAKLQRLAGLKSTVKYTPANVRYNQSIQFTLKDIAGGVDMASGDLYTIEADHAAKLVGADKRTVTIKDRDIGGQEVQELLKGDTYSVVELRMIFGMDDGDGAWRELAHFTFNEQGHYKAIKLDSLIMNGHKKEDLHASSWLMAKHCLIVLETMANACGGFESDTVDPEDDEL